MHDTPVVLVATKIDLRDDPTIDTISTNEGRKMRDKIKAARYMECSAKRMQGLDEIFVEAIRSATNKKGSKQKTECCLL